MSRGVRSSAPWRAASVGSSCARRGGNAARYVASGSGVTGQRPRQASWRRADTRGPVGRARHTAPGGPWPRVRRVWTQACISAGRCARRRNSRCAVPAAWRQPSWVAAAQSRPTKAAQAADAGGCLWDLPACGTGVPRDMPACALQRHEREPVTRQTLQLTAKGCAADCQKPTLCSGFRQQLTPSVGLIRGAKTGGLRFLRGLFGRR